MEISQSSIQDLVRKIKEEMLLEIDPIKLIAPSAYDTAWLAMIPDTNEPFRPMFKNCLDWVVRNQNNEGFWGDCDAYGSPNTECLPATIACIVALKRWNVGEVNLHKGVRFIQENSAKLLGDINEYSLPRWLAIVFPAMVELAHANGLGTIFPECFRGLLMNIFYKRQQIFEEEELASKSQYPPLLSYLEALPLYAIDEQQIVKHLCYEGSLFNSPSATAGTFMATGNEKCLSYLQSLVQWSSDGGAIDRLSCDYSQDATVFFLDGAGNPPKLPTLSLLSLPFLSSDLFSYEAVPATYPIDEELVKLCLIHQLHRLGLAEHFAQEIVGPLDHIYGKYEKRELLSKSITSVVSELYKDSLAFWLLRTHGYNVTPRSFCWFLENTEIQDLIEQNHEYFSSAMLNVYRATDLMFPGEHQVREARKFAKKILEKTISIGNQEHFDHQDYVAPGFHKMTEHELSLPWLARMDHLEHRLYIEEYDITANLWKGKSSYLGFSRLHSSRLLELAVKNYGLRQSVYQNELEELKRWSEKWGLDNMGFGREKTTYCYFAVAASSPSLPLDSDFRMIAAKSAIIITVADDFYDMEGSLDQLESLTNAIKRWDAKGLKGHCKTIFDALENLVKEMEEIHLQLEGISIKDNIQLIWHETFNSWLTEARWSRKGHIPSTEEYLKTGAISIATHTIALPASCFLKPSLPNDKLKPLKYETITNLLMIIPRLLNDIQSHEKEAKEGKKNFIHLYMEENPKANIEDSIAHVKAIFEKNKTEFLKQALVDGLCDMPKPSRQLHLSCLKVFQMFFNCSNRYDSDTDMVEDIKMAIYVPIEFGQPKEPCKREVEQLQKPLKHQPLDLVPIEEKRHRVIANCHLCGNLKDFKVKLGSRGNINISSPITKLESLNLLQVPKFKLCFF